MDAPRIVALDGYTANPGDLSWEPLAVLGDFQVHDRTDVSDVIERAADAEIVLTNKVPFDRVLIKQLPALRYIGVMATGYDGIDVAAANQRHVTVTNIPEYSTPAVAQMVFAHLLNLTQRVQHHAAEVNAGRWAAANDWCFWDFPQVELSGKIMGIVGLGKIGTATAKIADAFEMRVVAHTRRIRDIPEFVDRVELDDVFRTSDVVSLHCPLTDETRAIVDQRRLALMKPSAYLINTSRGGLIDEQALADALAAGRLAGAGLDVVTTEPPRDGNALFGSANCFVTPHIAWATQASRRRLIAATAANVAAFLAGRPINVVGI